MATLLAHIRVREGCEERFETIASELYVQTHASEKGCRRYEYWRGAERCLYYSLLSFDDFDAFLVHQTSDHHENASPALGELISNIELEWLDPLAKASDLPATEMQPLPDAADDKTRTYHRVFAATVQEWWQRLRCEPGRHLA